MRLPQMTKRRWMIALAAVAVPLAACDVMFMTRLRRLDFEHRALDHADLARVYGRDAEEPLVVYCFDTPPARNPMKAAYHAALARKWTKAAQQPWLPVEPDPPTPK
jgi:hypothetical protein